MTPRTPEVKAAMHGGAVDPPVNTTAAQTPNSPIVNWFIA
jgi:hypothetical protein